MKLLLLTLSLASAVASAQDWNQPYRPGRNELRHSYDALDASAVSCAKIQRRLSIYGYVYLTQNRTSRGAYIPNIRDTRTCTARQRIVPQVVETLSGGCDVGYLCLTR